MKVSFDNKSLIIDGKRKLLFGGEIHYFRIPPSLWRDRLEKIKRCGCNFVSTYIPWNFHEPVPGNIIWDGDRDLRKFLQICLELGLYVIIKPGPYICAEWDFGGFPDWLLGKNYKLRLPDKQYYDLVRKWYVAVADVIKPFLITNGGNIVLIQIENEYDHLMEMSEEFTISKSEAREYLLMLLEIVREAGIDIPAFTNEGRCILGTEIINTYTYYPNIPLIWMWEFNDFDRKIEEGKKLQPDKPLMIMELETGWFAQFGQPLYEVELELTEAITKSIITYGASVLNYYMFAGGTTFPYWHSKGDYGGIGTCTTFDFGGVPIREWGEINRKYHFLRNTGYFLRTFRDILFESDYDYNLAEATKGWDDVNRLYLKGSKKIGSCVDTYENIKVLQRCNDKSGFILARNLENETKDIIIRYTIPGRRDKRCLPTDGVLKLPPKVSLLLPIEIEIKNTGIKILHSTSELVAMRELDDKIFVFMRGKTDIRGELILSNKDDVKQIKGKLKVSNYSDGLKINYSHQDDVIFKIRNVIFIIYKDPNIEKLWLEDDLIINTDFEYLKEIGSTAKSKKLYFITKPGDNLSTSLYSPEKVKKIIIDKTMVGFSQDNKTGFINFTYAIKDTLPLKIKWLDDWKYKADSAEKEPEYNDSDWQTIEGNISLEGAGLIKHGYYWYHTAFDVPNGFTDFRIKVNSNKMDRFTLYVNGVFRWIGIGSPELDINELIRPGKNVITICYDNAFHTKAHPHEGPVQKLSGLFYPVEISGKCNGGNYKKELITWKVKQGLTGDSRGYAGLNYDDKDWTVAEESLKYVIQQELGNLIWFRRWFSYSLQKGWVSPVYLNITELRDRCLIYINGELIGKYENIGPQHKFYIPENMLREKNLITLLIEGPGFHPVKQFGFIPAYFKEPELGCYYNAKNVEMELTF